MKVRFLKAKTHQFDLVEPGEVLEVTDPALHGFSPASNGGIWVLTKKGDPCKLLSGEWEEVKE